MPITINGTTGIAGVDGSAGTPSVQGADTNTGIFFPAADTIAFSEGGAEVARFDSSGNFGIGVTPSYRLEVKGPAATAGQLSIHDGTGDTVTSGNNAGSLLFQARDSSVRTIAEIDGVHTTTNGTGGAMVFQTRISDTLAERMRIDSSGNLLVGATATNYGERLKITFPNTQGIHLNESTNSSSVNYQYFTKGSTPTNVGAIFYNGSVMAYQTTSDYRLKENIAPMTGALAKIAALKPVIYTWKDNQRDGEGFIAHELQKHFPDAVSGIKDDVDEDGNPKYQGMDASILIATLTAAIQEQQALIVQLQADVAALKGATA